MLDKVARTDRNSRDIPLKAQLKNSIYSIEISIIISQRLEIHLKTKQKFNPETKNFPEKMKCLRLSDDSPKFYMFKSSKLFVRKG